MNIDIKTIMLPLLMVLVLTSGLSFYLGILFSMPDNAKYMSMLIGVFAAIFTATFAFAGIVHSKKEERKLKEDELKRAKVEEFFTNLLAYLEAIDTHLLKAELLRINGLDANEKAEEAGEVEESEEDKEKNQKLYYEINQSFAAMFTIWGRSIMLYLIYKDSIKNQSLFCEIINKQREAMSYIDAMGKAMSKDELSVLSNKCLNTIHDMRDLTMGLMKGIDIDLV